MPRLRSIAGEGVEILQAEIQRLKQKCVGVECEKCGSIDGEGLSDDDLKKLERLLTINKLIAVPLDPERKASIDGTALVNDLKAQRSPELFPKRGRKETTNVYEPAAPKE